MVNGGLMAQMVQELLLCCQAGSGGGAGKTSFGSPGDGKDGGAVARVGLAASGLAARCLDALCAFAPSVEIWRRFLPGTFSGLFRSIRAMGAGPSSAASSASEAPRLTAIPSASTVGVTGRGTTASGGGTNSALAETCLVTLAKVILICAGKGADGGATPGSPSRIEGGSSSHEADASSGGESESGAAGDEDPLLVLRRLAAASNSSASPAVANGTREGEGARRASSTRGSADRVPSLDDGGPETALAGRAAALPREAARDAIEATRSSKRAPISWEEETGGRLRVLLPPLLAFCRLHPGWRVRKGAAEFASALLCAGNGSGEDWAYHGGGNGEAAGEASGVESRKPGLLGSLTPLLVEALVGSMLDDMPQVRCTAGSKSPPPKKKQTNGFLHIYPQIP